MLTSIAAFLSTTAGKIALGTGLTVATAGGAHVADIVDLPLLPDVATEIAALQAPAADLADEAEDGSGEEIGRAHV